MSFSLTHKISALDNENKKSQVKLMFKKDKD